MPRRSIADIGDFKAAGSVKRARLNKRPIFIRSAFGEDSIKVGMEVDGSGSETPRLPCAVLRAAMHLATRTPRRVTTRACTLAPASNFHILQ